jgi:hypothetical protein
MKYILFFLALFATMAIILLVSKTQESTRKTALKEEPMKDKNVKIRKSSIAGSWYPNNPDVLKTTLKGYLAQAKPPIVETATNKTFALIVPHAGYMYSGATAAYAYQLIAGRPIKRAFILGPSHYANFVGAAVDNVDFYETPLGKMPLDKETIDALKKNPLFHEQAAAFEKEHSVEIQLPFLQLTLNDLTIIPLVIGQLNKEQAMSLAESLRKFIDEETIVIVSSDFTHYGPQFNYVPFTDDAPQNLEKLNQVSFEAIQSLNPEAFIKHGVETGDTICGFNPIVILLSLAKTYSGVQASLLAREVSGNITGDFTNSVSYQSIALTRPVIADKLIESRFLEETERQTLLKLARFALQNYLNGKEDIELDQLGVQLTDNLKAKYGVFVTLTQNGQLRGCIGDIIGARPLYQGVIENAINAAVNDPRFAPVTKEEEKSLAIEISVLSPPKEIPSYREFVVGRDGIILIKNDRRAVFLPQVMVENKWTPFTALNYLAQKAGLPHDGWRKNAQFLVFSAEVFHEHE